ncbi:MAG: phoB [Nitrospirae bacterium]|nr:phoB [Nitrospirota bacterium]
MTKATILLVQNAHTEGNSTKRHLEGSGYAVVWAGSGVAALAAAKRQSVDLIVIDAALPDIEGSDLCRRFRAREAMQSVPIILLAGNGYTPVRSDGNNGGPDDFLVKPYSEGELDARIAVTLRNQAVGKQREASAAPALSPQPVLTGDEVKQRTPERTVVYQQETGPAPAAEPKPVVRQQEPITTVVQIAQQTSERAVVPQQEPVKTVGQVKQLTPERTDVPQKEPRPAPAAEPKPVVPQQEPIRQAPERVVVSQQKPGSVPATTMKPAVLQHERVATVVQISQQTPERAVVPQQEPVMTVGQVKQPTPERTDVPQKEPRPVPAAEPKPAVSQQEPVMTVGQVKQPTPERTDVPQKEPGPAPAPEPKPAVLQQGEPKTDQQPGQTTAAKPPDPVTGDEVVDHETGLFSRRQFETMFSKEFKRVVRFKQQMSCMMIDLEGGKLGRQADKSMLKAIVQLIQHTIREVDTAAWWSGEALMVLLPNTMKNDAVQAAARVLDAVAIHPFTWADSTKVTMSIGVAGLPDRKIDTEQKLIEAAAAACRRAGEFMTP